MTVTPVLYKGSTIDPSNYRTVSLLLILGKLFSHILLQRIKQQIE